MGQSTGPQKLVCPVCWLVFEAAAAPACKACGTAAPSGGWLSLPFVFRGRYQVVAQLGRGGMGAVFRAYDSQSPQQPWVALKVVQLKGDVAARRALEDAFRREGSAAAMLSEHAKYFVGFRGSDFTEPAYLALEFVEWTTLKAMRQEVGTLPPIDVARLGIEILRGVRWMERRRMVHRDLKPENIFAQRVEGGFRAKIADLGVWIDSGEAADTSLFGTGDSMRLAGTPAYMSPEQMRGEALTSASDLHMVASVLWELATGSVPYPMRPGPLLDALRERGERIRVPRERPATMPEGLYRILATALRFDPRDRTFADSPSEVSTAGPTETSAVRGMEKALEKFAAEYSEQRRKATMEARTRIASVETSLSSLEATLARARMLADRAGQIRREIQAAHDSTAEPETLNDDARRLTGAIERLREEATEALSDASARTALIDAQKEIGRERARAEAERMRAEEAERKLSAANSRIGMRWPAAVAAGFAVGAIGLVVGLLGLSRWGSSRADEVGPERSNSPASNPGIVSSAVPTVLSAASTPEMPSKTSVAPVVTEPVGSMTAPATTPTGVTNFPRADATTTGISVSGPGVGSAPKEPTQNPYGAALKSKAGTPKPQPSVTDISDVDDGR